MDYHLDALGSVRAVTNQAGTVVRQHDYFPFGEEYLAQGEGDSRRFTGKEHDPETGLDYFRARYLRAPLGRLTSADDTAAIIAGRLKVMPYATIDSPQSLNRYAYAHNNPLRFTDPSGHCVEDLCVAEFAAVMFAMKVTSDIAAWSQSPAGRQTLRDAVDGVNHIITVAADGVSLAVSRKPSPWRLLCRDEQGTR